MLNLFPDGVVGSGSCANCFELCVQCSGAECGHPRPCLAQARASGLKVATSGGSSRRQRRLKTAQPPSAVAQAQAAAQGHQGLRAQSHQQWWPKPNSHQRYRRSLSSGWQDIGSRTSTSPACGAVREKRALASTTTHSQGVVLDSNVVLVASLLLSSETQPQGGHELRAGPRWPEAGYCTINPILHPNHRLSAVRARRPVRTPLQTGFTPSRQVISRSESHDRLLREPHT